MRKIVWFFISGLMLCACSHISERNIEPQQQSVDILILNGLSFLGDGSKGDLVNVAIKGENIVYVGNSIASFKAERIIDASGLFVAPGFIDPHTHSLADLSSDDKERRLNNNYRTQGVTTVFNGNDGYGEANIADKSITLLEQGIGTNTAFFIGHGAIRKQVMGNSKRQPTMHELQKMKELVNSAMQEGALGLSTGLFYAPGSFSETKEIIALAKVVAKHGGVYDSHIRDESTYNIGLEASIDEVLEIGSKADIPVHIAHIKALGVDVWGKSSSIIEKINKARDHGQKVTADQYPWLASGTRISNALLPRWLKAGNEKLYQERLRDKKLQARIYEETSENLRKRGGPDAVLITQNKLDWQNKTLEKIASERNLDPVLMAIEIAKKGDAKIASFNMNKEDVERFMQQDWVMTSSDGSDGHPRKYASFPEKYEKFVIAESLMPIEKFLYQSSGLVAETFSLCDRGFLRKNYKADIVIFDPNQFKAKANFQAPEELSEGVKYLLINGQLAIDNGISNKVYSGQVLRACRNDK